MLNEIKPGMLNKIKPGMINEIKPGMSQKYNLYPIRNTGYVIKIY